MRKDKLVTIAIHTPERAKMLKAILEADGIETNIYNLNLLKPILSSGVRVRISEKDLPKALQIIEDLENKKTLYQTIENQIKTLLIPVDFSSYSKKVCEIGFRMAKHLNIEIILLHAYFLPEYSLFPNRTDLVYDFKDIDKKRQEIVKIKGNEFKKFKEEVEQGIEKKELPDCKYTCLMKEGVPEDVIIETAQNYNTQLVVMGTRGKNVKELELIGSVTAEVMERCAVPILAIPENVDIDNFDRLRNIVFATNLDNRMLISFDRMMNLFKSFRFRLYFTHFEQKEDSWNEIKLAGIRDYVSKMYPEIQTEYSIIKGEDLLESFDEFVRENKIDLIVLNTHKRNIFMRLFNPSMARRMLFHNDTPILVIRT